MLPLLLPQQRSEGRPAGSPLLLLRRSLGASVGPAKLAPFLGSCCVPAAGPRGAMLKFQETCCLALPDCLFPWITGGFASILTMLVFCTGSAFFIRCLCLVHKHSKSIRWAPTRSTTAWRPRGRCAGHSLLSRGCHPPRGGDRRLSGSVGGRQGTSSGWPPRKSRAVGPRSAVRFHIQYTRILGKCFVLLSYLFVFLFLPHFELSRGFF